MIYNSLNMHSLRMTSTYCKLTSAYLLVFSILMYYTNTFYYLGRYRFIPFLIGLVLMECIKTSVIYLLDDQNIITRHSKSSKLKNYYLKLKMKEILKCFLVFIGMTGFVYVLAVLFGAPLLSHFEETLTFSLLVSILSVVPICLNLGADNAIILITGMKTNNTLSDVLLNNIHMTMLGAWLGAVVIPLDWDRPWQEWPIPCSTGAIFGCWLAHVLTLTKSWIIKIL